MAAEPKLRVDVWADIACPWCYVGKRRLEAALGGSARGGAVEVAWRAFELDPSAPAVSPGEVGIVGKLAEKYGVPRARAEEMVRSTVATAAGDGLELRFDRMRPSNTFDAHRLIKLAGAGDPARSAAAEERLFAAYLAEGRAIGDRAVLVELGVELGLRADEVRAALDGDAFVAEVRRDEAEARAIGVRGVPFFVFGGRYAVSGAQPAAALAEILDKARAEAAAAG